MFSVDQNCHSLWDVIPKLHALARRGQCVRHFIEDTDVAFTSLGAGGDSASLRLARERFHRSGGADWGAAIFYFEFLGKQPVEIRQWEAYTGMKTAALARSLGCSVDDLYDEFSPSDNWQLIGPSYVGGRDHHRLVGDLTVAETGQFLRQMLQKARENCLQTFPQGDSQRRLEDWFDAEAERLDSLLKRCAGGRLVDLYERWLAGYLGEQLTLDFSSSLFACGADETRTAMLEVFLKDYDQAAALYNQAIEATSVGLRPLKTADGELPFFATLEHQGHLVRTAVHLDGGQIRLAGRTFTLRHGRRLPVDELAAAGVRCLVGKALLLVIQVRLGATGSILAVPYRGSAYMPAVHHLSQSLAAAKLLPGELHPILRVRFGLLDRLKQLETVIRLPEHVASYFGRRELPARELGENYASLSREAAERLEAFRADPARAAWQRENFPETHQTIDQLEQQRRTLARRDPKSEQIRRLGKQQKQLQTQLLRQLVEQISRDSQMAEIDYWDSRGAILPWCIGLAGEGLYDAVINDAETYHEPQPATP